ncbi:flagellar hook-length control protein FliK [Teredinibacter turnerae]|uniref:flagellar hook-length control protein FliK n=1 Tax=Teredinibacter turnerae TaxID=2426 RepID=UPI0004244388|nr:flagellar hook-length control protein FliK [Teredinibacter turnerae]
MQSLLESASSLDTVSTQKNSAKKHDSFSSTDDRDAFRRALDQERQTQSRTDTGRERKTDGLQEADSAAKTDEADAGTDDTLAAGNPEQDSTSAQQPEGSAVAQAAPQTKPETTASLGLAATIEAQAKRDTADAGLEIDSGVLPAKHPGKNSPIPASGIEVSSAQTVVGNTHSTGRTPASPLASAGGATSTVTVSLANGANGSNGADVASLTDAPSPQSEPLKPTDQLNTDLASGKLSGLVASSPATKMLASETFSRLSGEGELKEFVEVMAQASGNTQTAMSAAKAEMTPYALAQGADKIPVTIRFGQTAWAGQVAERTAMMVAQNLSTAELQLDPPELGPLQVKVTVHNDQATVTFVSANAQVREALDQSANRLRDMLGQQGVALGDVNVSDQSSQQSGREQSQDGETHSPRGAGSSAELLDGEDAAPVTVWAAPTGVDYYA